MRVLACGLAALGFRRGDNLAIIGDNRPRLYWAMAAAQCLGGIPVPLYQDAVAEEMVFVLNDADVRFAIVEDQEQVDKLLEMKDRCPALEHIIYDDPRGHAPLRRSRSCTATSRSGSWGAPATGSDPDFFRERSGEGRHRRRGGRALHLGHDGQAEGRVPDPPRLHRRGAGRLRVRPARRAGGRPVVPADGLGRRPSFLLRAGAHRRLHHQLPGVRRDGDDRHARDRPDLLSSRRRASSRTCSRR